MRFLDFHNIAWNLWPVFCMSIVWTHRCMRWNCMAKMWIDWNKNGFCVRNEQWTNIHKLLYKSNESSTADVSDECNYYSSDILDNAEFSFPMKMLNIHIAQRVCCNFLICISYFWIRIWISDSKLTWTKCFVKPRR